MRFTPLARIASSTLKVAIVFCCRSFSGMFPAVANVSVGGEMEDKVARPSSRRSAQAGRDCRREPDEISSACPGAIEKPKLAGRKVVPAGDRHAVRQQTIDQVGANETGGAGDENVLHGGLGIAGRPNSCHAKPAVEVLPYFQEICPHLLRHAPNKIDLEMKCQPQGQREAANAAAAVATDSNSVRFQPVRVIRKIRGQKSP